MRIFFHMLLPRSCPSKWYQWLRIWLSRNIRFVGVDVGMSARNRHFQTNYWCITIQHSRDVEPPGVLMLMRNVRVNGFFFFSSLGVLPGVLVDTLSLCSGNFCVECELIVLHKFYIELSAGASVVAHSVALALIEIAFSTLDCSIVPTCGTWGSATTAKRGPLKQSWAGIQHSRDVEPPGVLMLMRNVRVNGFFFFSYLGVLPGVLVDTLSLCSGNFCVECELIVLHKFYIEL